MKHLILASILMVAACGGSKAKNTEVANGGMGSAAVDPTIPSWAPKSCVAYAEAVTQAIGCEDIEKAKRDAVEETYEGALASWKAEQNATAERIAEVDKSCTSSTESVKAEITGHCVPATKPE